METLNHTLKQLFGNRGISYYKRMIDDYIKGDWNFDIKQLVEYKNIKSKVSTTFTPKGYKIIRTRVVKDSFLFEKEMKRYYNMHIVPKKEIKNNLMLAKIAFIKKWGFITEGNQICQKAQYNCNNCPNKQSCEIAKKYTDNNQYIKKLTKILELMYGNLCKGICILQVKESLKYL